MVSNELTQDREAAKHLSRMADRVCSLILLEDYPRIDIEIEKEMVREQCERLFPDRLELYEMIYESRFDRLWTQFREPLEADPADFS
ncbi:MAG: hypothetical protein ACE5JS_15080 [Nitrospinota bacterium]